MENLQHLQSSRTIQSITIFAFDNFFFFGVVESVEMFIIDVFYIDPFELEIPFEF